MHTTPLALHFTWIIAVQNSQRIENIAQRFQGEGAHASGLQLGVIVVFMIALVLILWRGRRWVARREGHSFCSSRQLFGDLCRAHQLDWTSRRLLNQLATARRLEHPAQLFLGPAYFDTSDLPASLCSWKPQLQQLRQRLFCD